MKAPKILATSILPTEQRQRMRAAGLRLEDLQLVSYRLEYDARRFANRLLDAGTQARVFTTKGSVRSLKKLITATGLKVPPKKTFTVGIRATQMLEKLGIRSVARAGNAISLAQIIARNQEIKAVDFFCGSHTLNDLPEYLESKNIRVQREEVFVMDMKEQQVETCDVDAAIFLTPSAVFSFFKKNELDPGIPVFCIGQTTASAVHLRCDNPRIISPKPYTASVVSETIRYFRKKLAD